MVFWHLVQVTETDLVSTGPGREAEGSLPYSSLGCTQECRPRAGKGVLGQRGQKGVDSRPVFQVFTGDGIVG